MKFAALILFLGVAEGVKLHYVNNGWGAKDPEPGIADVTVKDDKGCLSTYAGGNVTANNPCMDAPAKPS